MESQRRLRALTAAKPSIPEAEVTETVETDVGLVIAVLRGASNGNGPMGGVGDAVAAPCPLSGRELDALRGLAQGKVYKEIADDLSLSASTVRTHLHNVYRKLGAIDRAQAVLIACDRGWI
jgi:DNA-binding NarL/FixJ family response regulator